MLKKSVLRSMVGAFVLSSSGMALAMEDHSEGDPRKMNVQTKQKDVSEFTQAILSQCELPAIIKSVLKKWAQRNHTPYDETMEEPIIDNLRKAIGMHVEYGYTTEYIKNMFKITAETLDPSLFEPVGWQVSKMYPCQILGVQLGEESASSTIETSQRKILRDKLVSLHEKNPTLQKNMKGPYRLDHLPNYNEHFETIFRFMERMTEEQQSTTVSLLLPHLNRRNFGNFYPSKLLRGLDTYDVGDLNGVRKIEWLQAKLEDAGYLPESK